MVLYFCFGILIFLVCFIPIPTFSAGSSSIIKINELEEISHDEFIKYVFDPDLEKNQPVTFYMMQHILNEFFKVSVENDQFKLNRKNELEITPNIKLYSLLQIENIAEETDETLFPKLKQYFYLLYLNGVHLQVQFQKNDIANSGKVVENSVENILVKNDLFPNPRSMDAMVKKYTKMNEFNYKEMIAGFGDDYKGYKSFVLTYNQNTQKWEKKITK
ncbi:uncharacterized protein LOC126894997 isoform X5 [Daktulosphaira vitifoliae]|uniref:uncharacterized protein LOC126894997 isoform X5 n=1 Tax=Daktulosphaira vitifoliae TaxID=58002 RepID=UPI0021AA3656|nr:uncharacterized protein LOC126894997 isoform X5 [Daktulosphaira vitifoliae]